MNRGAPGVTPAAATTMLQLLDYAKSLVPAEQVAAFLDGWLRARAAELVPAPALRNDTIRTVSGRGRSVFTDPGCSLSP